MNKNPKFTIIIPVYNAEKFVEETVDSAFAQTYDNLEVIAVDNESTDSSFEILKKLQKKYPDLIVDTAKNIYPHVWDEARDRAFELMTGEYFMILPSDDLIESEFVENNMKILTKADHIMALQSPVKFIGAWNHTQGYEYKNLEEFKEKLFQRCVVNTPTVVWKKNIIYHSAYETKPEVNAGAGDYWMYFSLADAGIMVYPYPKHLGFLYRIHPEQATWGMHRNYKGIDQKIQEFWRNKWK